MRCNDVQTRLRALADDELTEQERGTVLRHLDGCSHCRMAHERVGSIVSLLHEQPLEEEPPHFGASLQVRLARHRAERQRPSIWKRLAVPPWQWSRRRMAAAGFVAASLLFGSVFSMRSINADEVARRAERSWLQIRNYGCDFVSQGVYQGQKRTFTQRQFFRRDGHFRLETEQDYPLTTFVRPDRILHYIPGGDWQGRGPLVIIRPRREGQEALPFPFGVTWQSGGNVSLDQLIRQLNENQDAKIAGKELVGDRECYRIQFSAVPAGRKDPDQYELWVDRENFLPRRVSWYRDADNHIVTEAQFLQLNYDVLPADTFDFRIPDGACVIHGDVDPHVVALPVKLSGGRPDGWSGPISLGRYEAWARRKAVPFSVVSPEWLPSRYEMVRVRRRAASRWIDMNWMRVDRRGVGHVIQLVQQDARMPGPDPQAGEPVTLRLDGRTVEARLIRRDTPYPHLYLTWQHGEARCTLFASDLDLHEVRRIAESVSVVRTPLPRDSGVRIASSFRRRRGEASVVPQEVPTPSTEAETASEASTAPTAAEDTAPPMMPEMPDEDTAAPASH